ncbi:MlaD family protein [Gordonia sp. CPCC 205333]|uniref:MlaD family protein n=1 Tax=Gordonia sp. CPCC 205333 TaxID=3140790 RepID=UPI003AF36649
MPDFRTPGMSAAPRTFAIRAVVAVAVTVIVATSAVLVAAALPDDAMHISMHTDTVAGGIDTGTSVVLNGDEIGSVSSVRADGNRFVVQLTLAPGYRDRPDVVTTALQVSYAPKNLFGISAVVLTTQPGGEPLSNNADFYPDTPVDSTLTTLLRSLSDLNTQAFSPYVSDILATANKATLGLLPVIGTVGRLATDIADTQKLSTAATMPQLAGVLRELNTTVTGLLPGLQRLMDWQGPKQPGYVDNANRALALAGAVTIPQIDDLLGENLGQAMPLVPPLKQIVTRIQRTFPDSHRNGLEIAMLIERIRGALPTGPGGTPVLNVDVVLKGIPGVTAALESLSTGGRG